MLSSVLVAIVLAAPILETRVYEDYPGPIELGTAFSDVWPETFLVLPGEVHPIDVDSGSGHALMPFEYRITPDAGTPAFVPARASLQSWFDFEVGAVNLAVQGEAYHGGGFLSLQLPTVAVPFQGEAIGSGGQALSEVLWLPADGEWHREFVWSQGVSAPVLRLDVELVDPTLLGYVTVRYTGGVYGTLELMTVPEPATAALVLVGVAVMVRRRMA